MHLNSPARSQYPPTPEWINPFRLVALICFVLSTVAFTQAQQSPQDIAVQSLRTMGFESPLLQGTIANGTITRNGSSGSFTIETNRSAIRYDLSLSSGQTTSVFANGSGWLAQGTKKVPLPVWVTQWKRPDHIPVLSRLGDSTNSNTVLKFIGLETVNGSPAYHLRISATPTDDTSAELLDRISEFHVYIDPKSFLVVKTITFDFSPETFDNRTAVDTYFSDYRTINGLPIPFHLTSYVMNQVFTDIQFTSVQLGVTTPITDFQ